MIKQDTLIKKYIFEKVYKTNQTELIQLSEQFTFKDLEKRIEYLKQIVNGDLIQNLMKENVELKLKLAEYEIEDNNENSLVSKLKEQNKKLTERVSFYKKKSDKLAVSEKLIKFQEDLRTREGVVPSN